MAPISSDFFELSDATKLLLVINESGGHRQLTECAKKLGWTLIGEIKQIYLQVTAKCNNGWII